MYYWINTSVIIPIRHIKLAQQWWYWYDEEDSGFKYYFHVCHFKFNSLPTQLGSLMLPLKSNAWAYYQFSSKSTAKRGNSGIVFWLRTSLFWKSCERTLRGIVRYTHHDGGEKEKAKSWTILVMLLGKKTSSIIPANYKPFSCSNVTCRCVFSASRYTLRVP